MAQNIFWIELFVIILFVSLSVTEAKSGCCSSHGGVCGSSCCDGSPLSVKCGGSSESIPTSSSTEFNISQGVCGAQFVGNPFCNGSGIYQVYREVNCTNSTKLQELCDWRCKNGICIDKPVCKEELTMPFCRGLDVYQVQTYTNCNNESKKLKSCDYMCNNGTCIEKQNNELFFLGIVLSLIGLFFIFREKMVKKSNLYQEDINLKRKRKNKLKI